MRHRCALTSDMSHGGAPRTAALARSSTGDLGEGMSSVFGYRMPTRIVFGIGALDALRDLLGDLDSPVLLVSIASMQRAGVVDRVRRLLGDTGTVLSEPVTPNPSPETVDAAVGAFRDGGCGAVVGLGGGSALDVAKCVAILAGGSKSVTSFLSGGAVLKPREIRFVAIPTTAGTGSEVTPWATIWDGQANRKRSLEHQSMFPTAAIVDPTLTSTLPPYQTAASGMDALTQAVEAYWSKRSQPISDMYALAAVGKICGSLEAACTDGGLVSRSELAEGSLLSGMAFSNTKTTICHSLSYPMTTRFGVAHGQAVSITLGPFLTWNAEAISAKLDPLLAAIGAKTVGAAVDRIRSLMSNIGLATTFADLGLTETDVELILEEGFYADRADNNPTPISADDARTVLSGIV